MSNDRLPYEKLGEFISYLFQKVPIPVQNARIGGKVPSHQDIPIQRAHEDRRLLGGARGLHCKQRLHGVHSRIAKGCLLLI